MDNMSGQGNVSTVPSEIKTFNWGAFLLNVIWGLFNGTYIAVLTLIPVVGLVVPFLLGFKGNEWAWRNKRWDSVETFRAVQRRWAIAGVVIVFLLPAIAAILYAFSLVSRK